MNFSVTNHSATPVVLLWSPGFKYFSVTLYVVIITVAFTGNLLACLAFILSAIVRISPTNHFIFSLAVSDLLTACFAMPFDLEQLLTNNTWYHGELLCQIWTTAYLLTVPSSIWNLLAVSVDRYKSLKDPLNRFRQTPFMSRKRAALVILWLWIYSGLFALAPVLGWKRVPQSLTAVGYCDFNITTEYSLLSSSINFILPTVFMCGLYWRIYKIASGLSKQEVLDPLQNSPDMGRKSAKSLKRRITTTKNILILACAFFFCWMPHTVLSIVAIIMLMACQSCILAIPRELYIVFLMLGYSSSALNPYLYALRNKQFRNALSRLAPAFRCKVTPRIPSTLTTGNQKCRKLLGNNSTGQSTLTRTTTL